MRSFHMIVLLLVAGCTEPVPAAAGDAAMGDGHAGAVDAQAGTGMVDEVTCQTHTRTVVRPDGTKQETDTRFALVDVGPDDDFVVESCDYTSTTDGMTSFVFVPKDPGCPMGATCTVAGAPYPTPASVCSWSKLGTFFDGKLYVFCGSETRSYDASNTLVATSAYGYGSIRIHR